MVSKPKIASRNPGFLEQECYSPSRQLLPLRDGCCLLRLRHCFSLLCAPPTSPSLHLQNFGHTIVCPELKIQLNTAGHAGKVTDHRSILSKRSTRARSIPAYANHHKRADGQLFARMPSMTNAQGSSPLRAPLHARKGRSGQAAFSCGTCPCAATGPPTTAATARELWRLPFLCHAPSVEEALPIAPPSRPQLGLTRRAQEPERPLGRGLTPASRLACRLLHHPPPSAGIGDQKEDQRMSLQRELHSSTAGKTSTIQTQGQALETAVCRLFVSLTASACLAAVIHRL